MESTFIEITNPNKSNILVGCIYRHPKMDLFEFIHHYLKPPLEKLAKEQKTFFLGDFNVDFLKYEQHKATNEFLDSLSSNMFLPHTAQPTRVSQMGSTGGGQFGQNDQKMHENYKISIFGSKQWGGGMRGDQANFLNSRGNPANYNYFSLKDLLIIFSPIINLKK